jgi:hypothetical protein
MKADQCFDQKCLVSKNLISERKIESWFSSHFLRGMGGGHFKLIFRLSLFWNCFFLIVLWCLSSKLYLACWIRIFCLSYFFETLSFTSFPTLCVLSVQGTPPGFEDKVAMGLSWTYRLCITDFHPVPPLIPTKFRLEK